MLTRPLVRPILRPLVRRVTEPGYGSLAAQIRLLFAAGEQGAWYDPSDLSSMNTKHDGSGTVPGVGDPVGYIADKSGRGNHATQPTDTARPTLQARVNLLERTEDFSNAYWNKGGVSLTAVGDGAWLTTVLDDLGSRSLSTANYITTGDTTAISVRLKATATTSSAHVGCYTGVAFLPPSYIVVTGPESTVVNGNRVVITGLSQNEYTTLSFTVPAGLMKLFIYPNSVGPSIGHEIVVGFPQLELGSTPTTYQRVTTATDYADVGAKRKIDFDGVDDKLTTTFPDLGSNVTIVRSVPGTGASILAGQTIGAGARDDSTDHHGLLIINRALTAPETTLVTKWANLRAGI